MRTIQIGKKEFKLNKREMKMPSAWKFHFQIWMVFFLSLAFKEKSIKSKTQFFLFAWLSVSVQFVWCRCCTSFWTKILLLYFSHHRIVAYEYFIHFWPYPFAVRLFHVFIFSTWKHMTCSHPYSLCTLVYGKCFRFFCVNVNRTVTVTGLQWFHLCKKKTNHRAHLDFIAKIIR